MKASDLARQYEAVLKRRAPAVRKLIEQAIVQEVPVHIACTSEAQHKACKELVEQTISGYTPELVIVGSAVDMVSGDHFKIRALDIF